MRFELFKWLSSQDIVDKLEKISPSEIASGFSQQGSSYLAALLFLVCLWLLRKIFQIQEKAHAREEKAHAREKERAELFTKQLDKDDAKNREILVESVSAIGDTAGALSNVYVEQQRTTSELKRIANLLGLKKRDGQGG